MYACQEQGNSSPSSEDTSAEVTAPSNDVFQVDEDVPNMFRIPPEIRSKILERLDAKNLLAIRRTHPLLKSLVDHYLGINATITDLPFELMEGDENKERFKFYSNVALRNLIIGDVSERKPRLGVDTNKGLKKSSRFHSLILYPQYLQTIQFEGAVSAQFARKVLLYCVNLRNFFIMVGANFTGGLIFPKLKSKHESVEEFNLLKREFHLTRLRALKLMVVSPRVCANDENHTENIVSVLKSTCSPFLTRLILQVWVTRQMKFSSISWTIANFLRLHPTLLSVFLGFMYENSQRFDSEEKLGDEELTRLLSLEKELHEISKSLTLQKVGFSSATIHLKFWVPLISQQSSLDHISLTYDKTTGSNWENICQNSSKSLLQFFVRGEFSTPFDCFVLDTCTKLEEFCLHNTNDVLHEILVKNVTYLPTSLTSLILFNTVTPTADILHLLRKLNKLRTLVLFKTGRGNGNGVDVNCLHHVFQMRSLMSVLIVRFIARDRHDAKQILEMMEIQENTTVRLPSENNVADDPTQESEWEDGWNSDTDSTSSGDSSSSSEEENNLVRSALDRTNSSNSIRDGLIIVEEQHTIISTENDNESPDTNNSSNDQPELINGSQITNATITPGGSSTHDDGNAPTTSTYDTLRGRLHLQRFNGMRNEFRHGHRNHLSPSEIRNHMHFEDSYMMDEEEDSEDEEEDSEDEDDEDDETEGMLQAIIDDPNMQPVFNLGGIENIAEMNLNPAGNELQVVFDGDINLEEIDLGGLIQFPDVQVHFVLDTILDIISPELENSHWTRKEDMFGNVIFNLRLCLQTDF